MRISRLYLPQPIETNKTLEIRGDEAHYIRTVLRLKRNDRLTVFNGKGGEFNAIILSSTRQSVVVSIGEWTDKESESPLKIHLGLAISRGERMDFALQKSVELGVHRIVPLLSERVVVHLNEDRKQKKLHHWRKVIISACEQCGRNFVPEIADPHPLAEWIKAEAELKLFPDPFSENTISDMTPPREHIMLVIGPEGGFTDKERSQAINAGFHPISLGPRILRSETASIAAIAAIQCTWGDWS